MPSVEDGINLCIKHLLDSFGKLNTFDHKQLKPKDNVFKTFPHSIS